MSRTEERIVEELKFLDRQMDMCNSFPRPIEEYDKIAKKISKRKEELWKELREMSKPIVQDAKTSLCVLNGIG